MQSPTWITCTSWVARAMICATPLLAGRVSAHDWYSDLETPAGEKCCDDRDCRPIAMCQFPGRREGLMVEGQCHPIPWDKVLQTAAPDGKPHACYWVRRDVYSPARVQFLCVVLPGAA